MSKKYKRDRQKQDKKDKVWLHQERPYSKKGMKVELVDQRSW